MATTIFLVNPQTFPSSTSYLLDTYSAAAAYSLRQLKTGVTNVVRVRRSSDNAESDFSATDITDGTLVAWTGANNGFVTKLYEQSGSGKGDLVNTVAGQQPKLVNAGSVYVDVDGLPYIVCDGVDDDLGANSIITNSSTHVWAFFVTSSSGTALTKDVGASTWGWRINVDVTGQNRTGVVVSLTNYFSRTSVADSNKRLLTSRYEKGVAIQLFKNGVGETAGVPASGNLRGTTGRIEVGRTAGKTAQAMEFQEIIIFETDESANRTAIESDINGHYSIY